VSKSDDKVRNQVKEEEEEKKFHIRRE